MNSKVVLDAELNAKLCDLGITEFGIPDDFRGLTCPVKSGGRIDFHGNSQHFLWKIDTSLQALNFTLDGQNIFVTSLDLDQRHDRRMERTHISKRDAEAGSPRCQPCHVYWTEGLELNLPITVTQKSLALASCPSQKSNIKHKTWVWTLENPLLKLSC